MAPIAKCISLNLPLQDTPHFMYRCLNRSVFLEHEMCRIQEHVSNAVAGVASTSFGAFAEVPVVDVHGNDPSEHASTHKKMSVGKPGGKVYLLVG